MRACTVRYLLHLMQSPGVNQLFKKLATLLGRESARLELKRMKESFKPSDLPSTFQNISEWRLQGEPRSQIFQALPIWAAKPSHSATYPHTRPETEDWNLRPANAISPKGNRPLSVLDPCNGSGCIPLLLCHLRPPGSVRAFGVDISEQALS